MNLQDLGSIGELIGAVATVATLVYLAVQIRHNSRGLDQNNELMRLSFENHIRDEGTQLRSLVASDPELAAIWRRGLAAEADLDEIERERFALLIINVLNMLGAHYDARRRGLAADHRATYLYFVARSPGFRRWWERWSFTGGDTGFAQWVSRVVESEPGTDPPVD